MALRKAFFGAVHDTSKPVNIFINDILSAKAQLEAIGVTIDDIAIKDVILMNLDESFCDVKMSHLTQPTEPELTTIRSVLTMSGPIVNPDTTTMKSEEMALSACFSNTSSSHSHSHTSESNHMYLGTKKDERGYRWCDPTHDNHCHRCGHTGHIAA